MIAPPGPAVTRGAGLVALALAASACTEEASTGAELEVIEEVQFAPELGIELADFTMLAGGVYYRDVDQGDGDPVIYGTVPTVTFTGWLADGTVFAGGTIDFIMGNFRLPIGFEEGLLNQQAGGTRVLIVPPEKGLGGIDQTHERGTVVVPGGSVLVYEVVVDEVAGGG